jgi:hypothetical protein
VKLWKTSVGHTEDKIKEWWDREHLLEDQVVTLKFIANTGESSKEIDLEDN